MRKPNLLGIEEARGRVMERVAPLPAERVALREALGRRVCADVASPEPLPGFDNSAMDGFALRAADTGGAAAGEPVRLRLAGESRAGHPAQAALAAGEAMGISTGAQMPAGADTVLRLEDSRLEDGQLVVERAVDPDRNVRHRGEDIETGEKLLAAGTLLGPAELGLLAAIGMPAVECHRRPRLAVLTGGDELLEPGEPLRPGAVRNSNAYALPALAELAGAVTAVAAPAPDRPDSVAAALEPLLGADVVVCCGGVSVGEHDHVKEAFAELGIEESFWGVALKPGKPTWFGSRGGTLVFGLPGNPVSAMVTFLLFARPALLALAGGSPDSTRATAILDRRRELRPERAQALRCRLALAADGWHAEPFERQGSHMLTSMLGADCLAMLPAGRGFAEAGDPVEVELLELGRGR
ncbi:MAG TPA: gephyrin-like molybdotransferase Glp [Solirubrobacterales bacterium]|nr:gephyrin-like molybdotransferase Glp [Solirubrobacterales bacterium]